MSTTILWDVDGTLLLNSFAGGGELYHSAVERAVGRELSPPLARTHGKPDALIVHETLAHFGYGDEWQQVAIGALNALSVDRAAAGDRRASAPGVQDALAACAAHGWTNALLTGNTQTRTRVKLEGSGLRVDQFDWNRSFFGETARARSEITRAARAALAGETLVIIGDTPRDDEAAIAAGIPFIGVATGAFTVDDLRQTGAVLVVADLAEGWDEVRAAIEAL